MKISLRFIRPLWLALSISPAVFASPMAEPVRLEPVIVEGSRSSLTQNHRAQAEREAAQTAGGATVVDGETLRDRRASTVADALGEAAGVFAQSRFGAQETRLSIRGSGLQRTFHTRGVVLLQDGIPLNLADGGGDFQSVELLAADHIAVFRGANALQYGAATLGGSINFVSPTGRNVRPEVRLETGSFGYTRGYAQGGSVRGAVDGFIAAGAFAQDGFRDHAAQREQRLTGNVGIRLGAGAETRFYVAATESDSELPGSLTRAQLNARPEQANAGNVLLDQRRDTRVLRLANKTGWQLDETTRIEASAYAALKSLDHPIFQVLRQSNRDYGLSLRAVHEGQMLGRTHRLIAGVQPQYGGTDDDRFVNQRGTAAARTDKSRQIAENLMVYAEDQIALAPRWTLVTGAQYVVAKREFRDLFFANAAADQSFAKTWRGFSPKLGALYAPHPDMQLFGNVSASYEPPSFGELAGSGGVANVTAQRGVTAELGARGRSGRAGWDVAIYHARIRDELLAQEVRPGASITINADRTVHQGVELAARYALQPWLSARVSGLVNDFRYRNDARYGDRRLPGVPRLFVRSELRAEHAGRFVALTVESAPQDAPIDMENSFFAEGYTVLGLKAGQTAPRGLGWFVEARNLADERYAASTGVIANARGRDAAQFLPGDGRSVYAGVQWRP